MDPRNTAEGPDDLKETPELFIFARRHNTRRLGWIMNLADERSLILFNERVERLLRSPLAKRMDDPSFTLSYKKVIDRDWICFDGVTEDAVDAFVLNIRVLLQERDGFSIKCLANGVYADQAIPKDLVDRFGRAMDRWDTHLIQHSLIKHFSESRNFTNRELFEIIMYGGLAHGNPDKDKIFFWLTKQGAFSAFVFANFLESLRLLLDVVRTIREVNTELMHS